MKKKIYEIESEELELDAQRRRIEKALSGRRSLPHEEVIRQQSEKWAAAWRREERV